MYRQLVSLKQSPHTHKGSAVSAFQKAVRGFPRPQRLLRQRQLLQQAQAGDCIHRLAGQTCTSSDKLPFGVWLSVAEHQQWAVTGES